MRPRLALAAFLAIAVVSVDLTLLQSVLRGEATVDAARSQSVAAAWSGYDELLGCARNATRPGDPIAIVVAPPGPQGGYEYAYRRAVYLLAGRNVVPQRIDAASHVVVFGQVPGDEGRPLVCRTARGEVRGPR